MPLLIYAFFVFRAAWLMSVRSTQGINSLDLGAGFAGVFAFILYPFGVLLLILLGLTRLPYRWVYWAVGVLLILLGLAFAIFGALFSPLISPSETTYEAFFALAPGGLAMIIAAVTGIIAWRT